MIGVNFSLNIFRYCRKFDIRYYIFSIHFSSYINLHSVAVFDVRNDQLFAIKIKSESDTEMFIFLRVSLLNHRTLHRTSLFFSQLIINGL